MERRDQVLFAVLAPLSVWNSTFFRRWSSTKGPFFRLRGMVSGLLSALLAGTAAADHHLVAFLVRTTSAPFRLTPRAHRVAPTGGLTLTTTVRVVDRLHRDTAHLG